MPTRAATPQKRPSKGSPIFPLSVDQKGELDGRMSCYNCFLYSCLNEGRNKSNGRLVIVVNARDTIPHWCNRGDGMPRLSDMGRWRRHGTNTVRT